MSSEDATNENGAETTTSTDLDEKHEEPDRQETDAKNDESTATEAGESSDKEVKLYVGNLPDNCRRASLEELFKKYGKVTQCDRVKNFAFVHMLGEAKAQTAIDALDDTEFMGTHIQVQFAKSKGKPAEDECFECGKNGHWARDCPRRRRMYGRDRYDSGYDYYRPPPPRYYDDRGPPERDYYYRSRSPPPYGRRSPQRYTGSYEGYPTSSSRDYHSRRYGPPRAPPHY